MGYCIFGVELMPNTVGFVLPGAGGLAGEKELVQIVAGIAIII